ncbi:MAG: transglutaminase family protein [Pseudomonadota bacterium]
MLQIRHVTQYSYEPKADRAGLRLKLFPTNSKAQEVGDWQVTVNGEEVTPLLKSPFGDPEALWFSKEPVEEIEIVATGHVALSDTAGVLGKMGPTPPSVFLRPTPLTEPDEAIADLAEQVEGDGDLARMHALNALVNERITYRKGATKAETTAAEALALGAGVCQDLTHVFLSAARALGLPARYVTGYLHEAEAEEPATHAWAEVHLKGLGWTGFDPTHEKCPAAGHIRLCTGFDAADAAPVRGHITGEVEESMDTSVAIDEAAQSQSQQ